MAPNNAPVLVDAYFDTEKEALREAENRRNQDFISRVEPAPYDSGYRVRSWPVDVYADLASEAFVESATKSMIGIRL